MSGCFRPMCLPCTIKVYVVLANNRANKHKRGEHRERDQPLGRERQKASRMQKRCGRGPYGLKLASVVERVFRLKNRLLLLIVLWIRF